MKYIALTFALLGLIGFSGMLYGCEEPGPAERMGEGIDEAGEEMRDAAEDIGNR